MFRDPDEPDALVVADWKRSKDIKRENPWESGRHPLTSCMPSANYWHYALQLSTYRYVLEKYYGCKIVKAPFLVTYDNFAACRNAT